MRRLQLPTRDIVSVKHFHEQLVKRHNYTLGYTVTRLTLQAAGLVRPARKRSAHRKKRARRPMPGMRAAARSSRNCKRAVPARRFCVERPVGVDRLRRFAGTCLRHNRYDLQIPRSLLRSAAWNCPGAVGWLKYFLTDSEYSRSSCDLPRLSMVK